MAPAAPHPDPVKAQGIPAPLKQNRTLVSHLLQSPVSTDFTIAMNRGSTSSLVIAGASQGPLLPQS